MKYRLFVTKEATQDAEEGFIWYEKAQSGLGTKFLDELDRYFTRIIQSPNQFPATRGERVAIVKNFPYKIVFQVENELVVVLSIYHDKRDDPKTFSRKSQR